MRKFLLIIFIFFCWCSNVYASERSFAGSEYLENIYYMKDTGLDTQFRRGQVIRDTVTGEIAYCIEPFNLLRDNSYYDETESYNSRFGISEEKWERIKLFAYHGYGYKNHTDKEWISITQMSIWRELFPYYEFDYIDNLESRNVIPRYNKQLDELGAIVNNYYTKPDFGTDNVYTINEEIELLDSKNVLNHYRIIRSDFDASISDNKLIVKTGDNSKEGTIILIRGEDKFPETVKYFYSTESQNVMERGNIKPLSVEIKLTVKTGKIIVNKIDNETENVPQGEAELNGSIFQLLNEKEEVIKELTINNNTLEFDSVPFGKYYIKEKKPGVGYYLNQEKYEVVIDNDNLEKEITIGNQVIKSKVKIIKLYGTKSDYENNKMKREKNVSFTIYDKEGNSVYNGVTNDEGIIEVMLPYGNYVLEQNNTTDGYEKNDNYYFSINENNSISYDIALNDFKIEVPNASLSKIKYLSSLLMEIYYV